MASTRGRSVVIPLTNKSGGQVIAGDVVIVDTSNNDAFTTTTSGGFTGGVGIAQETIANNASGRVLLSGYAALVNVNASVTRGNFGKTHTVGKQATDAGATRGAGTFCQFLTGGTTPDARVYPPDLNASSGSVATDAIFDAKGDLAAGTGADTAAKVTVGANGTLLTADSAQSTGVKWDGAWTSWTPVLTGSGGNPNLGSTGTITGRYCRIGNTIIAHGQFTFGGSGISAGTGNYQIDLPVNAASTNTASGSARLYDSSSGTHRTCTVFIYNADNSYLIHDNTITSATAPWTWATGDSAEWHVIYEAA